MSPRGNDYRRLIDDLIPPDVPVRDKFRRVYCNKKCALDHGVLVRDLEILTFNQRFVKLASGAHQAIYVGLCERCGAMI